MTGSDLRTYAIDYVPIMLARGLAVPGNGSSCGMFRSAGAIDKFFVDFPTRRHPESGSSLSYTLAIHREWLERRAAKRSNVNASNSPPDSLVAATTQRTTYMRKLIKFKNENEPLSENDISFVPHFGNGAEIGGGSNGPVGVNNGSALPSASKQQDRHHHHHHHPDQHIQQQWNFQHHGVHAASRANEKEILTDDAERYRYDVVSAQDGNRQEVKFGGHTEDTLTARQPPAGTVVDASDTKPLVYVMEPPVTSVPVIPQDVGIPVQGLRTGEIPATTATPHTQELTEKINAAVGLNHQKLHEGKQHSAADANPLNNDLSAGSNDASVAPANAATTDRKSDPIPTPVTWDTAEGALPSRQAVPNGVVRSSVEPSGEDGNRVLITTTDHDFGKQETVQEPDLALPMGSEALSGNVTVRNLFGPWSNWTACSRSCGGGVKTQVRSCWKRE
uniref:Uncharacterized protein n=1 Tax=Anopheles culicifacies TaxID=139723 RepID=A0A182MVA9_9DIPT